MQYFQPEKAEDRVWGNDSGYKMKGEAERRENQSEGAPNSIYKLCCISHLV